MKWKSLTHVWLFVTPWTIQSMEFSRPEGVSSLSLLQGIFPTQGSKPGLLHCRKILYQLRHQGSLISSKWNSNSWIFFISVRILFLPWCFASPKCAFTSLPKNNSTFSVKLLAEYSRTLIIMFHLHQNKLPKAFYWFHELNKMFNNYCNNLVFYLKHLTALIENCVI